MAVFNRRDEGLYLAKISLRIDLVVGSCRDEVVAGIEVFDSLIACTEFLNRNAKDWGWFLLKGEFIHLREAIYAFSGTDFERFFGCSPSVGCGQFESTDDMRMAEHENERAFANFLTSKDIWFAKEKSDKVDGMDEQIKECISLWVRSCKVMEIVIDKSLLDKMFPKDLHNWRISFLQAYHRYWRTMKSMEVNEGFEFCKRLARWLF